MRIGRRFLLPLAFSMLSAGIDPPMLPAQRSPAEVRCEGVWGARTSEAALRDHFGRSNVISADIALGEGETRAGAIVYPADGRRRIEVAWDDVTSRRHPAFIRFGQQSERQTYFGIGIGTDLRTVQTLNGRPFTLAGFDWDHSGSVMSWRNGRLANATGGECRVLLRFAVRPRKPLDERTRRAMDATEGDGDFSSSDPHMAFLNPVVYQVLLVYDRHER